MEDLNGEDHFISLHKRGDYYLGYGGELHSQVFRIHENLLSRVLFTDEGRSVLLSIVGHAFEYSRFETKTTTEGRVPHRFLFVPKVFLKPVCRVWDEMSNQDIQSILPHNVIPLASSHPKTQRFVYRIVKENDAQIVAIGEFTRGPPAHFSSIGLKAFHGEAQKSSGSIGSDEL